MFTCCCCVEDDEAKVPILKSEQPDLKNENVVNSAPKGGEFHEKLIMEKNVKESVDIVEKKHPKTITRTLSVIAADHAKEEEKKKKKEQVEVAKETVPVKITDNAKNITENVEVVEAGLNAKAVPVAHNDLEEIPDSEEVKEFLEHRAFPTAILEDGVEIVPDEDELKKKEQDMAALHKQGSLSQSEINDLYYRAEFECMDLAKDNRLCYSEFVKLLVGLGYHLGVEGAKNVWKECGKYDSSFMTIDEYIRLMIKDKELENATSSCRSVFAAFDWDSSGWASKDDIIKGLETVLGITVTPALEKKIQEMDSNKDGCIYYGDYLKMQLKGFK
ncbi:uncharacterized protein LOC126811088 [Patella vulgata]|uniref:uncharacterized protein LOC126811088 n=1 Tax=Patella vulgata TaxID=6465 RepID=UPI00218094F0|nr:uncharacterized protein LOC126811088 [Patella vulgata]